MAVENLKAALMPEALIVSLGAKLSVQILSFVYDWFSRNETVHIENLGKDFSREGDMPEGFVSNLEVQENVLRYISSFDESIVGFEVEEIRKRDEDVLGKAYIIHTVHKLTDGGRQSILLGNESGGTRKMLSQYGPLQRTLEQGSVIFIDELSDKLHPLLVRNIILTFLTPEINTNHAQLIFTTHDGLQFSTELLRRDELWVTDKDEKGTSTLHSVAACKDDEGNLVENYLNGRYGGIPGLKTLLVKT